MGELYFTVGKFFVCASVVMLSFGLFCAATLYAINKSDNLIRIAWRATGFSLYRLFKKTGEWEYWWRFKTAYRKSRGLEDRHGSFNDFGSITESPIEDKAQAGEEE